MKIKKIVSFALAIATVFTFLNLNAFALDPNVPMPCAETDRFYTPAMTAGQWWSGNDDHIHDLTCDGWKNYLDTDGITGADIRIGIYSIPSVGLPSGFKRDNYRHMVIEVKEDDPGLNSNDFLFSRTCTFKWQDNIYIIREFGTPSDVNTDVIETNSTLELYIRARVETKLGDTRTDIPPRLIGYEFGTTY